MDTRYLKYFIKVCETLNITTASELLFISQQSLSASIVKLEKDFGTQLFIRSAKGVEPTKAGLYLLEEAKKILAIENETRQYLSSFHTLPININIGCAYGVVHELSEKLLNPLELTSRVISPKFIEYTDIKCEKAVDRGEVDLGLAIGPIDTNKFYAKHLLARNYCFVMHKSHPLASQDTLNLIQLKDENLIMLNEQFKANSIFTAHCRQHGFTPKFIFETGEIAPVEILVQKQYGIGLSTDFIAAKYQQKDLCIRLLADIDYTWNVYLIWKRDRKLSKPAKDFIEYMTGEL